jgi:chromate transport protein ChrA
MPHPAAKPIVAGLLVTAVWAIGFRKQIEQRRISLLAMLVLVTLLAIWLAADQYLNPGS